MLQGCRTHWGLGLCFWFRALGFRALRGSGLLGFRALEETAGVSEPKVFGVWGVTMPEL